MISDGFVVASRGLNFSIELMSPVSATTTVICVELLEEGLRHGAPSIVEEGAPAQCPPGGTGREELPSGRRARGIGRKRFPGNARGRPPPRKVLPGNARRQAPRGSPSLRDGRRGALEVACWSAMGGHAKVTKLERNRAFIRGLAAMGAASTSIVVGGKPLTLGALASKLREQVALLDEIARVDGERHKLVARERALEAEVRPLLVDFEGVVRNLLGQDAEKLAVFALEPRKKPGPKTAAVKATSAVKARATRKRRTTMGKRQKAKVRG